MHWVFLLLAIAFEVSGTTCMKLAEGFTKLVPSVLVFVFYGMTLIMLTLTLNKMPVSVAYTVWSSVGTVAIVAIGKVFFGERLSTLQLVSVALIIVGVIGINSARVDTDGAPHAETSSSQTR